MIEKSNIRSEPEEDRKWACKWNIYDKAERVKLEEDNGLESMIVRIS